METQPCLICDQQVQAFSRYPNYVCEECIEKATDESGRPVDFENTSLVGTGCQGYYKTSDEEYDSCICYINGVECEVKEAYFGGIAIQPTKTNSEYP